jgi:putative hydrolase of the HAD superfamily
MTQFDVIAFDADDTLWHNETQYTYGKERFGQLLSGYQDPETIMRQLEVIEMENVHTYGYGIKSFSLSMVEAAVGITNGQVQGGEIQAILDLTKDLLEMQMVLFDQVEETLAVLSADYDLLMITKGDTFEQERKIERTGLAGYFKHIEIVANKTAAVYRGVLRKYAVEPTRFLMVGNSLRSDVLPVIEIGGQAVYIPYEHTWVHENMVDQPIDEESYYEIEQLGQLPELIKALNDR